MQVECDNDLAELWSAESSRRWNEYHLYITYLHGVGAEKRSVILWHFSPLKYVTYIEPSISWMQLAELRLSLETSVTETGENIGRAKG